MFPIPTWEQMETAMKNGGIQAANKLLKDGFKTLRAEFKPTEDRMARRGNRDNDGKYLRLTGLWPSKKNDALWTGKFRNQDIGRLQDKVQEADDAGADIVVFLWENTEKKGKKDPEFTVQISVSEDDGNGRGRGRSSGSSRRSSRDREESNEEDNNEENNNEKPEEEEEEKPSHRSKSSKKEEPRSRRSSGSKKDKNDW